MQNLSIFRYFMVPDQHEGKFYEYSEENFNLFDTALSERFEALLQTSKTNSFKAQALQQHISSTSRKNFHYQTLHKALEEIAVLYNWDRPLMHSPVKKFGKSSALNAIYIITKLPNDNQELCRFLGKPKSKGTYKHKDIYDKIFNQHTSRAILNVFKSEPNINVNVIDTAMWRKNVNPQTEEAVVVKNNFKKCLFQLHGNVIPVEAFRREPCIKEYESPHSTPAILNMYGEITEKHVKSHEINVICQDMNFVMNCNESSHQHSIIICGFFKKTKTLLGLMANTKTLIWPKEKSVSTKAMSHFMLSQNYCAIIKSNDKFGIWNAVDANVFSLKLLGPESSAICSMLIESNPMETIDKLWMEDYKKLSSQDNVNIFTQVKNQEKTNFFNGNVLESTFVSESKPFQKYTKKLTANIPKMTESVTTNLLKKSYLPHSLSHGNKTSGNDMIRRKSSEESVTSNKGLKESSNSQPRGPRSRGAELLRLGSKNAELRRSSNEEFKENTITQAQQKPINR